MSVDTHRLSALYYQVLEAIGEDPNREGLRKTPERVARAMAFLLRGYDQDPYEELRKALYEEPLSEMVVVKNIELYSMCEHHLLPFFGRAHVAYIPNRYIVGLSKIARVVDIFARRLQVQERLTRQILDCIQEVLQPQGAAVVIEARHLCMMMRGVEKQNSVAITSAFTGVFMEMPTREEFLHIINLADRV